MTKATFSTCSSYKIFYIIFYNKMKNNPQHHELCERVSVHEWDERAFCIMFSHKYLHFGSSSTFLPLHSFILCHIHTYIQKECISLLKHSRRNGVKRTLGQWFMCKRLQNFVIEKENCGKCTRKIKTLHLTSNGIYKIFCSACLTRICLQKKMEVR